MDTLDTLHICPFTFFVFSFFTTNIGSVYEVNYKSLKVVKIYKLFDNKHSDLEKNVSLNTISFSPNFVAVGSNEGVLQLWSTNFKSVLLEAGKLTFKLFTN